MRPPLPSGRPRRRLPAGFILLEVLLAVALFGLAGLGLAKALSETARAANATRVQYQMLFRLESAVAELHKSANIAELLTEGTFTEPDEMGIYLGYEVLPIEDMQRDPELGGQLLQDMWLIRVTAFWERGGKDDVLEKSAETWRYEPLYQPQ